MSLSDLVKFNERKHRAASLRQLSFLSAHGIKSTPYYSWFVDWRYVCFLCFCSSASQQSVRLSLCLYLYVHKHLVLVGL